MKNVITILKTTALSREMPRHGGAEGLNLKRGFKNVLTRSPMSKLNTKSVLITNREIYQIFKNNRPVKGGGEQNETEGLYLKHVGDHIHQT